MDMLGKHAWGKPHREFESPPFRNIITTANTPTTAAITTIITDL